MPLPLRKQNCFLASTGGVGILDLRDLDGSNSKKICQMHPQPSLIQSADSSDPSLFSSFQSTSTDSRGPNILLSVAYLSIPCMYAFLACQVNAWWFLCCCGFPEFESHSAIWNSTSFSMFLSSLDITSPQRIIALRNHFFMLLWTVFFSFRAHWKSIFWLLA